MQRIASSIEGMHDFAAFGTPPRPGGKTVRTVHQAIWYGDGADLVFEISADAFLYRMVRRLVSYQVEVGQGKWQDDAIAQLLETPPPLQVQGLAPPHGLTLFRVDYPV
jgi:tRNA pseudouridine38-40 synthase